MATGDVKNNLKKLQKQATLIRYPQELDYVGLTKGDPEAHLSILYYAFHDCSLQVHEYLSQMGCNLAGKKGPSFLTLVFKLVRDKNPKVALNLKVPQFMSKGFAERKIILTTELLQFVRTCLKHLSSGRKHDRSKTTGSLKSQISAHSTKQLHIPDVSTIGHHEAASLFASSLPRKEIPIKQMQSTTVIAGGSLAVRPVNQPLSSTVKSFEEEKDCNTAGPEDCSSNKSTFRKQDNPNANESNDGFLEPNPLHCMKERLDELEKSNMLLMKQVSTLKTENQALSKEIKTLRSTSEMEDLLKRISALESKVLEIDEKASHFTEIHSPVCGDNLCNHFKMLHLDSKTPDEHASSTNDSYDRSLANITNESPAISHQRPRLLELVKGTRSLLGMDDTPRLSTGDEENVARSKM